MAIFGGENTADNESVKNGGGDGPVAYGLNRGMSDKLWTEVDEARERIAKRHSKYQEESAALNREYERLCEKVRVALAELETFEKEKFGMRE